MPRKDEKKEKKDKERKDFLSSKARPATVGRDKVKKAKPDLLRGVSNGRLR